MKDFVVVIGAGYGGHSPEAVGKISKEKNIDLKVTLKLDNQIRQNCNDAKVVYTRSKDVFIPLGRRAEIASNAKADLSISIHANTLASNRTAKGAFTRTLDLIKSDVNLEVVKQENFTVSYEGDYKARYASFNPSSAESHIIFEFMRDKYIEQSMHLASLVQRQFRHHCKRISRGVHQAGFLTLEVSTTPSILVGFGFISTPEEERYLNTDEGTITSAKGIYRAFLIYKRKHEIRLTNTSRTISSNDNEEATEAPMITQTDSTQEKAAERLENFSCLKELIIEAKTQRPIVAKSITNNSEITFKIQILTSLRPLAKNDKRLRGLRDVDYYKEDGMYGYTYGAFPDCNKALRTHRDTVIPLFRDTLIITFHNGEKMSISETIAELRKRRGK